jgi:hypothetical protein
VTFAVGVALMAISARFRAMQIVSIILKNMD